MINIWVVSDDDEDYRGWVLRLCGTCVLVARVCSANCDLNSFHLPSCPRLSLLSIIPLPSCARFALSSCPLSTLGKPSQKKYPFFWALPKLEEAPHPKLYHLLTVNFPQNQCNRECFLGPISPSETSLMTYSQLSPSIIFKQNNDILPTQTVKKLPKLFTERGLYFPRKLSFL